MTKPNVFSIRPNLALDDAQQLFLNIMGYAAKRMTPEQVGGLCDLYNAFKPKAARDAAPQPSNRKDQQMPEPKSISQENKMKAAINFVKTRLSDEDLEELQRIMAEGGSGGEDEPVTMAAMAELDQARKETAPVIGASDSITFDTAAKIYGEALRVLRVPTQGVRDAKSLRAIYRAARMHPSGRPQVAMDSARVTSLHERYPHAAKIGGV